MISNYFYLVSLFFAITIKHEVNCDFSDLLDIFRASQTVVASNYSTTNNSSIITNNIGNGKDFRVINVSVIPDIRRKKLQIGRVTNKPYAIVNMLWRKTKIFQDQELDVTPSYLNQDKLSDKILYRHPKNVTKIVHTRSILATSPSFIQYYHLDDSDIKLETKECSTTKLETNINNIENWPYQHFADFKLTLQNPVFSFHVNNRYQDPRMKPINNPHINANDQKQWAEVFYKSSNIFNPHDFKFINLFTMPYKPVSLQRRNATETKTTKKRESLETTTKTSLKTAVTVQFSENLISPQQLNASSTKDQAHSSQSSKIFTVDPNHDKIKFFELYDNNTFEPILGNRDADSTTVGNVQLPNENQLKNVIETLDEVNKNIGHGHNISQQIKHAKKHIVQYEKDNSLNSKIFDIKHLTTSFVKNPSSYITESPRKTSQLSFPQYAESKHANWSNYPFVAVYIYEPLQVHCDAAAISRHWLICAGSCLSRHHKNPSGLGRSAFVTYCGEAWWEPERVAYVKYSIVHPGYHPRDKTRKRLYNIGLIQVVNSMMSACTGLLPIALMSHQFSTVGAGSRGTAVGWGLDRFDSKYPSFDLPRSKLFVYESQIYSNSCPGNAEYSKATRLDDLGGTNNIYCLALPPYHSEENDSVHGTLLLFGGKLVALYLQEERRPWGQQCAEYTGTWRLMSWILEIAREPEDFDTFSEI